MARFWIIICLFACLSLQIKAQTRGSSAPSSTLDRVFNDHFQNADNIVWTQSKDGYDVAFRQKGLSMIAHYSITEVWEYTDVEVPQKMMPEQALNHFRSSFSTARILETSYHDAPEGSFYRIRININGASRDLHYNDQGKFIGLK